MAKTYTSVPNVATGDVYTASSYNTYTAQNINNLRVPPAVSVFRSSNLTSYGSTSAITWQDQHYDTDDMWASGSPTVISITTSGIYMLTFAGQLTATATMAWVLPQIARSGTTILNGARPVMSGTEARFALSGMVNLTAGDSLTANLFISGGSAYSITGGATYGQDQTRLALTWLGQVS